MAQVHGELGHGEEVRLSGNVAALGSFISEDSISLSTSSSSYPIWWLKGEHFLLNNDR